MIDNNYYVYKKEVNWSVLHQGVGIPLTIQVFFQNIINEFLPKGKFKNIYLVLKGKTYKARLVNQKFDERKYPNRKDILQIRYHPQSEIAEKLRSIFTASYKYILEQRNSLPENQRKFIKVPESQRKYLIIYTTDYPDTFLIKCIMNKNIRIIKEAMVHEDGYGVSYNIIYSYSTIAAVNLIVKIRKLKRVIEETLKLLYNYRRQICGENISARYGVNVVESHHIPPFVESLNNNAENQVIICPNHYRIIHRARPVFGRKKLIFVYHSGVEQQIVLNQYL